MRPFGQEEIQRYSRQLRLPDFGEAAQARLKGAHIGLIGCGGLAAPVLYYLAAAGVGTLTFVDDDTVDLSNLQRQIIHFTPDTGLPKVESAAAKLRQLNPHVDIRPIPQKFTAENADAIAHPCDILLDATDNFATKALIHDTCIALQKPYIHASVSGWYGQMLPVIPSRSACLRCLFPEWPQHNEPEDARSGPIGPLPGLIGTLQALEAIHYFIHPPLFRTGELLTVDTYHTEFKRIKIERNPACVHCNTTPPGQKGNTP